MKAINSMKNTLYPICDICLYSGPVISSNDPVSSAPHAIVVALARIVVTLLQYCLFLFFGQNNQPHVLSAGTSIE